MIRAHLREWARIAAFYKWTFDYIRSLTPDEYEAARYAWADSTKRG